MRSTLTPRILAVVLLGALALPSLAAAQGTTAPLRETAVAPERNPPGDIPDDQAFISYDSSAGFTMQVPEGWARRDRADGVTFEAQYGTIDISVRDSAAAPTQASVTASDVPALQAAGRAVEIAKTREIDTRAGKIPAIDFTQNSEVNPVTNRQIRLESRRLFFFNGGREAIVTFSAPAGADNVDAWNQMTDSFRWVS